MGVRENESQKEGARERPGDDSAQGVSVSELKGDCKRETQTAADRHHRAGRQTPEEVGQSLRTEQRPVCLCVWA